jgi:WD40 repeat protein
MRLVNIPWRFLSAVLLCACAISLRAQDPNLIIPVGHTGSITTAKFSHDNKYIVSGGEDKAVIIWETKSGKKIQELSDNDGAIKYAYFSNNDQYIIAGTDSGAGVWETSSFKRIANFQSVRYVVVSGDSRLLVVASFDGSISQIDIKSLRLDYRYEGIGTKAFEISGDGVYMAGAHDSVVEIRDTRNGSQVYKKKMEENISSVFFTPDSRDLFVIGRSSAASINIQKLSITPLNFHIRARNIFSTGYKFMLGMDADYYDGSMVFTDIEKSRTLFRSDTLYSIYDTLPGDNDSEYYKVGKLPFGFPRPFEYYTITIEKYGRYIIANNHIYNTADLTKSFLISSNTLRSTDFTNDGKMVLVQGNDGELGLLDIRKRKVIQQYKSKTKPVYGMKINHAASRFAVFTDTSVKVCNILNAQKELLLKGQHEEVSSLEFSASDSLILTNSWDSTARLWDAYSGKLIQEYPHQSPEYNPAYFPVNSDKVFLVKAEFDTVMMEDLETGNMDIRIVPVVYDKNAEFQMLHGLIIMAYSELHTAISVFSYDSILILDKSGDTIFNGPIGITGGKYNVKYVRNIAFVPGGQYLLVQDGNDLINVFSIADKKIIKRIPAEDFSLPVLGEYFMVKNKGECDVYDLKDFTMIYRYISLDEENYLVTDPFNRYDGTEAARKELYYSCGFEIVDLEQFKDLGWEPSLAAKLTGLSKEPVTAKKLSDIKICGITPLVEELEFSNGAYHFRITPRSGGIGEVRVYINNKLVKIHKPETLTRSGEAYLLNINENDIKEFLVPGQENNILVKATVKNGDLQSRGAVLLVKEEAKASVNPDLYIISIGVSQYKGQMLKLGFASKDATDMASAISASGKKLLNTDKTDHVFTWVCNTEAGSKYWPGKETIKAIFDTISLRAKAEDIFIMFFAGHGVLLSAEKKFYLLTSEASTFDLSGVEKQVAISMDELNDWMRNIKANKQVLILDACNSGMVVQNMQELMARRDMPADQQRALENLKDKNGTFILTASAAGQAAYETSLYGQGLLTYSLLSGIKLGDGLRESKYIDITKWFNTASSIVEILAKDIGGRQEPKIIGSASFDIGLVDKDVTDGINLAMKKKIFRRSNFIEDEFLLNDDLELSMAVNKELNNLSARGKESPLAYAADNTLPDAYSIRGRYEVNKDSIIVKVTVVKGKEKVYQFDINWGMDKKEELAMGIVEKVRAFLN